MRAQCLCQTRLIGHPDPQPALLQQIPDAGIRGEGQAQLRGRHFAIILACPVAPGVEGKSWLAPSGTTLREMLMKWAQDTRCESGASAHWTVIWPVTVTDYRLDAPLTFRGSFETMLGQMFELYRTAQKPLYAEASRMQCVISVTDIPAGR